MDRHESFPCAHEDVYADEYALTPARLPIGRYALAVAVAVGVLFGSWLVLAQLAQTQSAAQVSAATVHAVASGVRIDRPDARTRSVAVSRPSAGSRAAASASAPGWRYPQDGSLIQVGRVTTQSTAQSAAGTASSEAAVERIEIDGGRVVIEGASIRGGVAVYGGSASERIGLAPGVHVRVDGDEVAVVPNLRVPIEGVGTLVVGEQAVVDPAPTGDDRTGPRQRVVGAIAHLTLSHPVGGLPAGSEIVIGRVDASVVAPLAAAATTGAAATPPPLAPTEDAAGLPRRSTTVRSTAPPATGNLQGYQVPVLGAVPSDFPSSFGAPRADTGFHEGNDIFAAEGTPIVAVADGILDRVGWNSIGGWRFWLTDRYGNRFYHAHLSAYAPIAREGARVHAGDVIGFVGHTGDAQGTPPHAHFEIHGSPQTLGAVSGVRRHGDALDPQPFLLAWRSGKPVQGAAIGVGGVAPLTLLGATDVGAVNGLAPGRLEDALPAASSAA